jgi:anti-sigma factor (TIGR02949 family)
MSVFNYDSKQCERIRRHLDAYLSNELLVETTSDVLRHLESCETCARELETRTRVRDALRKAAASRIPPEELRQSIQRQLRKAQLGVLAGSRRLTGAVALAGLVVVVLAGIAARQWIRVLEGRRIVAGVLALGVSDHLQCAIKGHNYPDIANPPELLRQKLGPRYAEVLEVVQQNLPGFEILEAHICSVSGSSRKYVHFITRGHGTILSVILTRSEGERLGMAFRSGASGSVNLYEARLEGMNVAGFESKGYLGFVVSDLDRNTTMQIASKLAPPLKAALEAGPGAQARADLDAAPPLHSSSSLSVL